MKWYKKQMDELLKKEKKGAGKKKADEAKSEASSKKAGNVTYDPRKVKGIYPNPVAARNRNRPKTDSK